MVINKSRNNTDLPSNNIVTERVYCREILVVLLFKFLAKNGIHQM